MVDPAHGALDDGYTPEDDSQEVHSVFSDEGPTRRLDNGVSHWDTSDVLCKVNLNFFFFFFLAEFVYP